MSVEAATTLAAALIGLVVLVLNYLRERTPSGTVNHRLQKVEGRLDELEAWRHR